MSQIAVGPATPARKASPAHAAIPALILPATLRRFGVFSALATAIAYTVFLLSFFANSASLLPIPWDQIVAIGASLLIAPSFVLLMVAIHYATPESRRMWTLGAIAFGILYAAFVSTVYVTLLFVVEPHVVNGTQSAVAPFLFAKGTFVQMLDGLGYSYMSLAVCLTAPVFAGGRLARSLRWLAMLSGPAAIGVLTSYYLYSFPFALLGIGSFLVPAYAWLMVAYFRRARVGEASE
ncbi:MAG TPA: hypothetical protein VFL27_11440 [Candidatus Dormibacteraeota bacterium]|nr:hypothetical protein [Candidatus Dormibacteraeota bacterium]